MTLTGNHFLGEAQIERLRPRVTFRLTSLWAIARADGTFIRLATTEKDVYFEGNWFLAAGPSMSDLEQGEAAAEADFEISGILDHETILETDIYAGRFDKARIDHWVVDLERPWVWFRHHKWWIKQVTTFGGAFKAEVVGVEKFLTIPIGRRYEKDCDRVLGSAECGAASVPEITATVTKIPSTAPGGVLISTTRDTGALQIQQTGGMPTVAGTGRKPVWSFGSVTFNDGANSGVVREIGYAIDDQEYLTIVMAYEAPFNIRVGDSVTIKGGCDGTKTTCAAVFDNLINFGGQPSMPNTSTLYESPEQTDASEFESP